MTTGHARTHGPQTRTWPPSSWRGGSVVRGTLGWYGDASGGFFLKSLDEWNPRLAFLVFPRITSSSRIDRCDVGRFVLQTQPISTLPIARQDPGTPGGAVGQQVRTRPHPASLPPHGLRLARWRRAQRR